MFTPTSLAVEQHWITRTCGASEVPSAERVTSRRSDQPYSARAGNATLQRSRRLRDYVGVLSHSAAHRARRQLAAAARAGTVTDNSRPASSYLRAYTTALVATCQSPHAT